MKIDVATAFEGCSEECEAFEIYSEDYHADGRIYYKRHECRNMKLCMHLLRHLVKIIEQEAEKEAEDDNSRD